MATFTIAARNAAHAAAQAKQLAQLAAETHLPLDKPATGTTPAGDTTRLRGIPAIGRGVAGHIPGTNPSQR